MDILKEHAVEAQFRPTDRVAYTADVDDMVVVRWDPAKQGWVKVSKFGGMPQ